MANFEQNRSYNDRLNDFSSNLGQFLDTVWKNRNVIKLKDEDYAQGIDGIYGFYIRNQSSKDISLQKLRTFITRLRRIGSTYLIVCQQLNPEELAQYDDAKIISSKEELCNTFFHICKRRSYGKIGARAYVHAVNWPEGLKIIDLIVKQFPINKGLVEVKIAGPGLIRDDTIVAYFNDRDSRDDIVQMLTKAANMYSGWFADRLPSIVKREGKGIGSADEQPEIPFYKAEYKEGSFGTFYSAVVWLALKNTPNISLPTVEPRHFLDNVLYNLRLLKIDPKNPTVFPAKNDLEEWYSSNFTRLRSNDVY